MATEKGNQERVYMANLSSPVGMGSLGSEAFNTPNDATYAELSTVWIC